MSLAAWTFSGSTAVVLAGLLLGGDAMSVAQSSGGGLEAHANSHATAADVGLPAYPGATFKKSKDDDASFNLGFAFGDFRFSIAAVNYLTSDSPAQVLAFYRKALSPYGQVLECDLGKPVGPLTVTRSGLTCADQHGDHVQVNNGKDSSNDHELRAGSPLRYRVVGIDRAHAEATHFALVYVELPKESDEKSKP